jgi:hypothetical protein
MWRFIILAIYCLDLKIGEKSAIKNFAHKKFMLRILYRNLKHFGWACTVNFRLCIFKAKYTHLRKFDQKAILLQVLILIASKPLFE